MLAVQGSGTDKQLTPPYCFVWEHIIPLLCKMHWVVSSTFYLTKVLSVENTSTKAPLWSGADVDQRVPPHRGFSKAAEILSAGKRLVAAGTGGMILRNCS